MKNYHKIVKRLWEDNKYRYNRLQFREKIIKQLFPGFEDYGDTVFPLISSVNSSLKGSIEYDPKDIKKWYIILLAIAYSWDMGDIVDGRIYDLILVLIAKCQSFLTKENNG